MRHEPMYAESWRASLVHKGTFMLCTDEDNGFLTR